MFSITRAAIDPIALHTELEDLRAGACVAFDGRVRNHHQGREVLRLEYEAYEPLALAEGHRILAEILKSFEILDARCIHRLGVVNLGESAVWIGVTSVHRREAFEACQYVIDQLKRRVPIWKKEIYAEGDAGWVACHCTHTPTGPQKENTA